MHSLTIRPWEDGDAQMLIKYGRESDYRKNFPIKLSSPFTLDHALELITDWKLKDNKMNRAIDFLGDAVGGVSLNFNLTDQYREAKFTYWLAATIWGDPLVKQVMKLFIKLSFEHLKLDRIIAQHDKKDRRSQKYFISAGFRPIKPDLTGNLNLDSSIQYYEILNPNLTIKNKD